MKVGDVVTVLINDPRTKPLGSKRVPEEARVMKVNLKSVVVKLFKSGKIIDRKIVRDFGLTVQAIAEHESEFKTYWG